MNNSGSHVIARIGSGESVRFFEHYIPPKGIMNCHNESCADRKADPILTQVFVRVGNNWMLVNASTNTAEEMIDKALKGESLYPLEYTNEIMVLKPELGEFNIYKVAPNPSYELTPVY